MSATTYTQTQVDYLRAHVLQIAHSFIVDLSDEDVLLCVDETGRVYPDGVSNHHLIDLLAELDASIFWHYCDSMFRWMSTTPEFRRLPFTLDSYTKFCPRNSENLALFKTSIADKQLTDGSFPIYTAFVHGGDFFSTLWATKILISYDKVAFSTQIELALSYLKERVSVAASSMAQVGFFLFVLLQYQPSSYEDLIDQLASRLLDTCNDMSFDGDILEVINNLYVLEDLTEYFVWCGDERAMRFVETQIHALFELQEEPHLPNAFASRGKLSQQAPYRQMVLKAGVVATKFLKAIDAGDLALLANAQLHGSYRRIMYVGLEHERILRNYRRQYGEIEETFRSYENELAKMWELSEADYDHSVFIMMPFKRKLEYRALTKAIKQQCEALGFKAFRVDDPHRAPFDTLWDNIVVNMLGCRYGISIYVTDTTVDRMTDELRFFENPNVALEFGFMKSRGKRILILKDKASKTPSDLQGFMWKPFDIENPDTTVPPAIAAWIQEISSPRESGKS